MIKTHFDAISERVGGVFERGTNETRMIETQRKVNGILDGVAVKGPLNSKWTTTRTISLIYIQRQVQQELPSQSTTSWSGSKKTPLIQEEDDTIKRCMEVFPAWSGSKKNCSHTKWE
ncbi:hypothetical protein Tco_1312447 [Tanacetum coccineum]